MLLDLSVLMRNSFGKKQKEKNIRFNQVSEVLDFVLGYRGLAVRIIPTLSKEVLNI